MLLNKTEWRIFAVNFINLAVFGGIAMWRRNWEFLFYGSILVVVIGWILPVQRRVRFSTGVLWGLTIWGIIHMAGGNVHVGGGVLYEVQLLPVVLRYDQLVHAFGFGVATLVCHHLLRPYLIDDVRGWKAPAVILVLAGAGVGVVNEIIEFVAAWMIPETGVGGYTNTMLDLVFNMIGATIAMGWVIGRNRRSFKAV